MKWIWFALILCSSSVVALDHQVEPGDDLNAVQGRIRSSRRLGKEAVTVTLRPGVYRLSQPLRFSPQDGGSKEYPVVWKADGDVVITGARRLQPNWKRWKNGIYFAEVDVDESIDQLFVNGRRQIMARYPNRGAGFIPVGKDRSTRGKRAGNVPYDGCTPNAWDKELSRHWKDPTGAFMHGMHGGLWGSQHYRVLGKAADESLRYEGGWQNNRSSQPHAGYRMIENVLEELDAAGEWFHDSNNDKLYFKPNETIDLHGATIEAVLQTKHLVEVYGDSKNADLIITQPGNGLAEQTVQTYRTLKPVQHLRFEGIRFVGTARTLMDTVEPLLRSDWTIYRGGAVHLRGTENITIENCRFEELGGNAVFVDHYNRGTIIRGNHFRANGASDVNLVGSFEAVRDPTFNYRALARPLETIDKTVGPKCDEYPADCLVENNLMQRCGRFEKQVAGINISMSSRITARHNTISHTPRAAINICDGTWGGHLIEWNDCFETVLETHDHGAFNGWGRDRIWHRTGPHGPDLRDETGKALISYYVEKYPQSPTWDCYQTSVIRNNRMQCDHGWDIDLDDGCSNYQVYNNLCLQGGLKTREGHKRIVTNNVIMGKYTCNVPYPKPTFDVFERNIVWGPKVYITSNPALWGGSRNFTFVHNPAVNKTVPAKGLQDETMDDAESLYGNAQFVDPVSGNFQVSENSPALEIGFQNFPMTGFGVTSDALKKISGGPAIRLPTEAAANKYVRAKAKDILGARVKTLDTESEISATGMHVRAGAYLVNVPEDSLMAKYGFKGGDVLWQVEERLTPSAGDLQKVIRGLKPGTHTAKVWRSQAWEVIHFQTRK